MRIGIAGAGLMGKFHALAARRSGANLAAIADPDEEKARLVAARNGGTIFATAAEMLDAENLDALHICTPTADHAALIRHAIAKKIHVLVEKPLAPDAATTRELTNQAAEAGLELCPVHQYAFQRCIGAILRRRNEIGSETKLDLVFHSAGGEAFDQPDYLQLAADILPHPVSVIQQLFPASRVDKADWRVGSLSAGTWELAATISDVAVRISIGLAARPTCVSLELWGTRGAFRADLFHDFVQFRSGRVSRRSKIMRPFADAMGLFSTASVNLARRVLANEPAYPGLRTLIGRFYDSCEDPALRPISSAAIVDVANLRDRFLDAARLAPATPFASADTKVRAS